MVHLKSMQDTVTVFIRLERAQAHAQELEAKGAKARVIPVTLHETAGGATYGHAVRYREPQGAWQYA